jgi:hypothetical protein
MYIIFSCIQKVGDDCIEPGTDTSAIAALLANLPLPALQNGCSEIVDHDWYFFSELVAIVAPTTESLSECGPG